MTGIRWPSKKVTRRALGLKLSGIGEELERIPSEWLIHLGSGLKPPEFQPRFTHFLWRQDLKELAKVFVNNKSAIQSLPLGGEIVGIRKEAGLLGTETSIRRQHPQSWADVNCFAVLPPSPKRHRPLLQPP